MDITAPKDAAPEFLTSAGYDDAFHAKETVEFLYFPLFNAGVVADLFIYGYGGHGGAISSTKGYTVWDLGNIRFQEWLVDLIVLKK